MHETLWLQASLDEAPTAKRKAQRGDEETK
eukprot:COSAG06_NODE_61856_length_266_cov_1.173653_1_plen_29_part_10